MGEFVHVYNDGGGIRNASVLQGAGIILGGKDRNPVNSAGPCAIAAIGTPFAILPGDNSTNGMFFTNSAGAFTLSAAILAGAWNALKGVWCYLPANFGGKTYPAGWYWAVFSSDTAGILYNNTYSSGVPVRPSVLTPFPDNLAGWVNQTTSEVTGPTGITIAGGLIGPNGNLKIHARGTGGIAGTKTFRHYLGASVIVHIPMTANPSYEFVTMSCNQGSESLQSNSRISALTGVGQTSANAASEVTAVDTGTSQTYSISLQISANTVCAILLHADVSVTYGA